MSAWTAERGGWNRKNEKGASRTPERPLPTPPFRGRRALLSYRPQVLNVNVSCTGCAARPAGLEYCLTTPVRVSVTVAVKSTSVVAAKKTQKESKPWQASRTLISISVFEASKNQ